ncbi:MAG: hypothetical protein ABFD90_09030 [Phycisphaerales bacterium]
MEELLKHFLERTTPLGALARFHRERQLRRKFLQWERNGAVGPMPNYGKQQAVRSYAKRFSPPVFIETGTYKGKMVYALIPYVTEIYSIELDPKHYGNARRRFAGYPNIHLFCGQSGEILPEILKGIREPCLFWLDAHWSGGSTAKGELETPIMQEIECILAHPLSARHVVLIDDARCFTGQNDYPTLETLRKRILAAHPDWLFEVKDDIIRTHCQGDGN